MSETCFHDLLYSVVIQVRLTGRTTGASLNLHHQPNFSQAAGELGEALEATFAQ